MKLNTFSVHSNKVLHHTKTRVAILISLFVALNLLVPVLLPGTQATASAAANQEFSVSNYTDAQYLNELPWGKQSFYVQPWRAYMETVPATQLQAGVGINYTLPEDANNDAAVGVLSRAGFTHMRLEMSWTKVKWDETGLLDGQQERFASTLAAMKKYNVTPLILLNANDGIPGPNLQYSRKVVGNFKAGATTLTLDSVADLTPKMSGISNLTQYKMNEILFTSINTTNKTVTLSKPLPVDLGNNTALQINTFKYSPLYPVGTPEFNNTMSGWLKYTRMMLDIVKSAGITNFDVEIWNELTFGSDFLSINNYYANPIATFPPALHPGGQDWELANQTENFIKANYTGAKVIWGFSNTSFYETNASELPTGTDGMSFHPYGTDKKVTSATYPDEGRASWFIEGYIPQVVKSQPEGWAHDGVKTETLTHLLNPQTRLTNKPTGTTNFMHYFTEHGSTPSENGITDTATAEAFKQKSLIRSLLFWLNKGIDKVDIFSAWQDDPLNNGQLYSNINPKDYANYTDDQLMTPALKSLQNMMGQFKGAVDSSNKRQLGVDVTSLGTQYTAFKGDATHPDLYDRDLFTFLPFQVNPNKFVVGTYVMSYDITTPLPSMDFKQTIKNVNGLTANVTYYDPITNQTLPVNVVSRDANSITVITSNVDYPRLLTIDDSSSNQARGPLSVRSSVQITAPSNNTKVASNSTVILKASAQDSAGISKVEFYANNQLICTTTSAAATCRWDVARGSKMKYVIKVVSYNTKGDTQSSSIQVTTN